MMNKKGFAISVVLYTMVILIICIFYLLLGIVRHRYVVGNDLKQTIINGINPGRPPMSKVLSDIVENTLSMTDADSDGTKYVAGDTDIPNYLWYSGKLWRIVAVNSDGSVKLVTQGNMTTIAWDKTSNNTDYSNSQVRKWLNEEFLPTLFNADDLLVNATWDYTAYPIWPRIKLETTNKVTDEKVGLLNVYEFWKTDVAPTKPMDGNSVIKSFLNNGFWWWTMSPKFNSSSVWVVDSRGGITDVNEFDSPNHTVRPSVNLVPGIKITDGDGSKTNPYVIENDKLVGEKNELLSNRISGEYVKFNNTVYRIVGIEEINGAKLTKITMADYSLNKNSLFASVFGLFESDRVYSPNYHIGLSLQQWYQADSTSTVYATNYINDTYKAMIATANDDGIVWYTGPTNGIGNDYTLSKTGTPVSATIGMGYYGEMFSTNFGDGEGSSERIWLITIFSKDYVIECLSNGIVVPDRPLTRNGVRPSFYLKSDVKISGGKGRANDPYEIK